MTFSWSSFSFIFHLNLQNFNPFFLNLTFSSFFHFHHPVLFLFHLFIFVHFLISFLIFDSFLVLSIFHILLLSLFRSFGLLIISYCFIKMSINRGQNRNYKIIFFFVRLSSNIGKEIEQIFHATFPQASQSSHVIARQKQLQKNISPQNR